MYLALKTPAYSQSEITTEPFDLQTADSLNSLGEFDKAIPIYQDILKVNMANPTVYLSLAYSYIKLGLFREGKEHLLEYVQLTDSNALEYCLLADVSLRKQDLTAAAAYLDSLKNELGTDPSWSLSACTAEIELHLGNFHSAKTRLIKAIDKQRSEGEATHGLTFLAFFYMQEGNRSKASDLLNEHEKIVQQRIAKGDQMDLRRRNPNRSRSKF